ncbi:glycosyltransferase family 4 protein [Lutibacter citreus]|uniref:glycosyltransferase family 4 protein n=1 Tax=Lutibacter citreus TaxID=2138210 RepID=UPI000DBE3C76|nr:glycosyltransferase family 4 protein [Lutibacter citreus]
MKKKLIRITTVPISLEKLLEGQLGFMKSYFQVIAVSSEKERLNTFGEEQNIPVFHLEMTRKITPIKDLISLLKLYKYLKKEKPFIVHTHTPKAGIVGMLAAKMANVPNRLHTVAGLPLLESIGIKRKVLNFVEKLTYSCATKVYPNSMGLKEIIIKNNFAKPLKLKVLANGSSNGIDTEFFNPQLFSVEKNEALKQELGIQKNDFVFIFVGRIVGDKGINELVAAFEELQNSALQTQKFKLLLVGPFEQDLDPLKKETIHSIKNNPSIISVGYQQDVRPYFAISDVLVFPSYREGFPNVVMQAGAMGLPSIVTNINGCNEIVVEGKNGWVIPVKNTEAILSAMRHCLINTTAFIKAKSNARIMIETRYEQQLVWEAILEEYKVLGMN